MVPSLPYPGRVGSHHCGHCVLVTSRRLREVTTGYLLHLAVVIVVLLVDVRSAMPAVLDAGTGLSLRSFANNTGDPLWCSSVFHC